MATLTLTDSKLYVAGFDVSGDMSALSLAYSADALDATTFGNATRISTAGLKSIVAQHEGFWNSDGTDQADDVFFSRIGTQNVPVSICPATGADGEPAYIFRAIHSAYNPSGSIGEMLRFSVNMEGSDGVPLVRATVLQPAGAETATDVGTGRELGAVSATQSLYGALHVLSASASDTLDVVVESDADNTFASATTRLTFAQMAAIGSDWQTAAGAIADTWYRVSFTIGGASPSFSFVVTVGIA